MLKILFERRLIVIEKYNVIITAGGRIEGNFSKKCRTKIKALVEINGETIISKIIRAFRESKYTGEITIIGPKELNFLSNEVDKILPEGKGGMENLIIGIDSLKKNQRAILCGSDIPLITGKDIDNFIDLCPSGAGLCYPICEKSYYLKILPGTRKDFVKLKNVYYTGGSIFLVDTDMFNRQRKNIEILFNGRKNPISMIKVLGISFIFKFLFNNLGVSDIEERVSEISGTKTFGITQASPRLAFDIDNLEDYEKLSKFINNNY